MVDNNYHATALCSGWVALNIPFVNDNAPAHKLVQSKAKLASDLPIMRYSLLECSTLNITLS